MNIYSIYTFTNSITGKKYVGYTGNVKIRIKKHKHAFEKGVKTKLYDAMRKYGWKNFIFEVIYQSKEKEHTLNVMENYFISEYDSFHNGYNLTLGGEGVLGTQSWCKGKKPKQLLWNEDRKKKHSNHLKSIWNDEKKFELSNKWTEEMKKAQKEKTISSWNQKIKSGYKVLSNEKNLVCPHCNKTNNIGNSKRWHFDKCKNNKTSNGVIL